MGHYVHIHVCFACNNNDGVAALAKKHLPAVAASAEKDPHHREAAWFLKSLSQRTGYNPGPKGGLSLWGMVGNYTDAEAFVEVLKPFWLELLSTNIEGAPHDFEHILVFYEHEQSEQAHALEIYLKGVPGDADPEEEIPEPEIVIKKHKLPFAWMQY